MSRGGPGSTRWPDVLLWLGRQASVGERVTLAEEESQHLTRVLRRRVGEAAVLADGHGGWIDALVVRAGTRAELEVRAVRRATADPVRSMELGFPILRPSRTDWLLEKATELGVTRVVPLETTRGTVRGVRPERWQRVLQSAAMQCARATPPQLGERTTLLTWAHALGDEPLKLVAAPGGHGTPRADARPVALLVGPEGDLSTEESSELLRLGFMPVDLGRRRLRAETAALVLIAEVNRASSDAAIEGETFSSSRGDVGAGVEPATGGVDRAEPD